MKPGDCKYFTGAFQNEECDAGVNYRGLVGGDQFGWLTRLPCCPNGSRHNAEQAAKCDKYTGVTAEEAEAYNHERDREIEQIIINIKVIRPRIVEKHGQGIPSKTIVDSIDCPVCNAGTIKYSISSINGHIHAACNTNGCVRWME